jgi:hypothetical protein
MNLQIIDDGMTLKQVLIDQTYLAMSLQEKSQCAVTGVKRISNSEAPHLSREPNPNDFMTNWV